MRFGVLGPLTVWTARDQVVQIPGTKARALLAALLAAEGRAVSTDRLVDDLWNSERAPDKPEAALQTKVWQLRRALETAQPGGRDLVVRRGNGYLLRVDPENIDAIRFTQLTAHARTIDEPRIRKTLLAEALALWRGQAYADHADYEFARSSSSRLEETRLTALEAYAETRLALGEHAEVASELNGLVQQHPLRETLRTIQIRALYRAGRVSAALAEYQDLRTSLADELGLDPSPELTALQTAILNRDPALLPADPSTTANGPLPQSNLPAPRTELIGRDEAVAEVTALLRTTRLVTLTGPGGVGKTQLALATARQLADDFPDGICLIELASLGRVDGTADPVPQVLEAIMAALGIPEKVIPVPRPADRPGALIHAVRDKRLLLVLDNCEHIVEAVAEVAHSLLEQAPLLRVLATSQEPIGIAGETMWSVPPLHLPDSTDYRTVTQSSAARLFIARATAAAPGFTANADNFGDIALICRRLDGLPLALELAATRVRALGIRGLLTRLDDRFRLLTTGYRDAPARQQTLRAMIDWSWELLSEPEQIVLRRLAVHGDGGLLESAERVCADATAPADTESITPANTDPETPPGTHHTASTSTEHAAPTGTRPSMSTGAVFDLLARLVDRSLVVAVDTVDGVRYRMLESVADYGRDRLRESGELDRVRGRHRDYYLELAELAAAGLHGPDQRHWLRRLDSESANLRRAHEDTVRSGRVDLALRLAEALVWYWFLRGRLSEAIRILGATLELGTSLEVDTRLEMRARLERDRRFEMDHRLKMDYSAITSAHTRVRCWRAGFATLVGERVDVGEYEPATALPADAADTLGAARARWFLGFALFGVGDQATSERLIDRALAEFTALGDTWGVAAALTVRANQAHVRGDLGALERDGRRSAELFTELGDQWGLLQTVEPRAALAEMTGDYPQATRLHQTGLHNARELGLWAEAAERLTSLGSIAMLNGEHEQARDYHRRAKKLAAEHKFKPGEIRAEVALGLGARRAGHLDTAETHLRHVLDWLTDIAFEPGRALALAELGFIAEQRGDTTQALRLHLDGWTAAQRTGDIRAAALALEGLAGALANTGQATAAALLLGSADAARRSVGLPLPPAERGDVDRITRRIRDHLSETDFDSAYQRGQSLAPTKAVTAATTDTHQPTPTHEAATTIPPTDGMHQRG